VDRYTKAIPCAFDDNLGNGGLAKLLLDEGADLEIRVKEFILFFFGGEPP